MKDVGKLIMLAGGVILVIGLLVFLAGDKLRWFGHLPGDIRVEKPGFRFYAPLASMLLLSIVLSLLLWLFRKLF